MTLLFLKIVKFYKVLFHLNLISLLIIQNLDVNGLRQTNKVLNDRTQLLLKRISDFSESNNILTTRLSSLEREKDTIHKLLENERHKNSDLSKVIEVIRAQLAGKDVATRKFVMSIILPILE